MHIPSPGGPQETLCLRLDLINGWLFKIDAARVKSDAVRQKVIEYQRECYQVLYQHFHGSAQDIDERTIEGEDGAEADEPLEVWRFWQTQIRLIMRLYGVKAARSAYEGSPLPQIAPDLPGSDPQADSARAFLDAATVADPTGRLPAATLYQSYEDWCARQSRPLESTTLFGRRAGERYQKAKMNGVMVYLGVAFRSDGAAPAFAMSA